MECPAAVQYFRVPAKDSNRYPLDDYFDQTAHFIEHGDRVLVHCHSGHSRSAALVLMFLVSSIGMAVSISSWLGCRLDTKGFHSMKLGAC